MEDLKKALENLSQSIKELEDAVVFSIQQQNRHKEKIETLQSAIQTTYERIDKALADLETKEKEDEICLSLP
ncbi:MAG: hypothetical protein J6P93_00545 [Alphaproteobacteria bacterium]|nr:hypothetical protein [Alphaproteobacteria bacterium]